MGNVLAAAGVPFQPQLNSVIKKRYPATLSRAAMMASAKQSSHPCAVTFLSQLSEGSEHNSLSLNGIALLAQGSSTLRQLTRVGADEVRRGGRDAPGFAGGRKLRHTPEVRRGRAADT